MKTKKKSFFSKYVFVVSIDVKQNRNVFFMWSAFYLMVSGAGVLQIEGLSTTTHTIINMIERISLLSY